jgi:pyridoxal 5'-phosphate synthase pdxT subunit
MRDKDLIIGVLGIQGDIEENVSQAETAFHSLGKKGEVRVVRHSKDISGLSGLILPGGESTVVSNLATVNGDLFHEITDAVSRGMPVLGTCAGMIILSTRAYDRVIGQTKQKLLSLLNIVVERNAFGRQKDSFEADMEIPLMGKKPFKGIFIRAPIVSKAEAGVQVIAKMEDKVVAVKQDNIIATAFHPELGSDIRFHVHLIKSSSDFRDRTITMRGVGFEPTNP